MRVAQQLVHGSHRAASEDVFGRSVCSQLQLLSPSRVNLSPEGGRELAVLLDHPHLTEPQPSQRLEAPGRESRSCLVALCGPPRQAAPPGNQPLLVMSCTDTSGACRTLSAHLQGSWRHSEDGYHLTRPRVQLSLIQVWR